MFKQEIKYTDFNGVERQETFYFHLSLPEVVRLEAEIGRPIDEHAKALAETQNVKELIKFLESTILNAYGKRTADGKSFQKSKEIREEFEYSNAYAELFEMLLLTPDLARKFGEGIADNGKKKNQIQPQVVTDKVE